ncbi:Smr/MutS family protein [Litorimonas sp. RW-G-Af-16]
MARRLGPDEKQVWQKVAKTVAPRRKPHGKGAAKPLPSREDFANMLRLPPPAAPAPRTLPQTLDVQQDKKTRRGLVHIDRKIDLHDMTQAQAKPALHSAIIRASNRQQRCVLVVTGKGLRLNGVLRRNFIDWISDPDIRPLIASYAQAHIRHGGTGAWYVFLKS